MEWTAARRTLLLLLLVVASAASAPLSAATCSYEACNAWSADGDTLNIHVVAHTHDDMGWLKNVDEYYWGANNGIAQAGVQYIIDTVVQGLEQDPSRRFSYCETGFFWRWLQQQSDFTRHQVRRLVNNGQLELINGGWTQNDEAAAYYVDMIEQTALGHRRLNDTFGRCGRPTVTWQVDPFGHSRENANLFAMMGFDATFFAREHFKDKAKRLADKSMEMLWRGSDSARGAASDLFTHAFYWWYYPPPGFCFDCNDPPIMDDRRLEGYNLDAKVTDLLSKVADEAAHYRHNHAVVLMGGDFHWQNADVYWKNIEKLKRAIDGKPMPSTVRTPYKKVSMFYSTPSCYVKAVNSLNVSFPTKSDDFFPYASGEHAYWTGYYSSRPAFKRHIRQTSAYLQLCKQVDALAALDEYAASDVDVIAAAVALSQHHDAITGTAKQAVTDDYQKRLARGAHECQRVLNEGMAKLFGAKTPPVELCPLLNVSVCPATANRSMFSVTVFNPLAHERDVPVTVPFGHGGATVVQHRGFFSLVPSQVSRTWQRLGEQVRYQRPSPYQVHFVADAVPPLGLRTFLVSASAASPEHGGTGSGTANVRRVDKRAVRADRRRPRLVLENEKLRVEFDRNNQVKKVTNKVDNVSKRVSQTFMWYEGMPPTAVHNQPSGAYVFRPNGTAKLASAKVEARFVNGTLVQEVRQVFSPWISQVVRLWAGSDHVEFQWLVGPIPIGDRIGKEVVTRFGSDVRSASYFYTDANGRQFMRRKRNYQPTYEYENSEPVSGNYYPVTSAIFIKDSGAQLTLITDRAQGGTSVEDGSLELMLHRRLLYDDNYGVGEPLLEPGPDGRGIVCTGTVWMTLNTVGGAPAVYRRKMQHMYKGADMVAFSPLGAEARAAAKNEFAGLRRSLPDGVNLLTLEQWRTGRSVLLRLENVFQADEGRWAKAATVDLKGLFATFDLTACEELTLSANRLVGERHRLKWRHDGEQQVDARAHDDDDHMDNDTEQFVGDGNENARSESGGDKALVYKLKPMEIITLRCSIVLK